MEHVIGLRCVWCGEVYSPSQVQYVCPKHGDDGNLDVLYDYDRIRHEFQQHGLADVQGMWRYHALLPIPRDAMVPPLLVGGTPLYDAPQVARKYGVRAVSFKDDGRNPTGSLKDRASALIVARARAQNRTMVTTASTGNAAAALAGLAASIQMPSAIFVPATAPEAKVIQLLVYGAHVFLVNGAYDDAFKLCLEASHKFGWYCRNTGYNPYTSEGKKTVAYEICEQLSGGRGTFKAPDAIVVTVGDGNIISGVHKGLKDLKALGWIDHIPRLIGVQAEGSAALYQAWKDDIDPAEMRPIETHTIADSISAGLPRDRVKALRAVKETGGAYVAVSDQEILESIPAMARATGVFAEPAGAAGYAGFQCAVKAGLLGKNDSVTVLVTGNGLKDVGSARRSVAEGYRVEANIDDVSRVVSEIFGS